MAHPGGRPSKYTQELADAICLEVATSARSVKYICDNNPKFPSWRTVFRWGFENEQFWHQYVKAKAYQSEVLIDECIDISDDTSHDTILNKNGDEVCNNEYINRSRLRVETRKWAASKLQPKRYGDKQEISHKGDLSFRDSTGKARDSLDE